MGDEWSTYAFCSFVMLKLSFHQTKAEMMVRAASTVLFNKLLNAGCSIVPLSELTEPSQYGFTAGAELEEVGPKLVRITDLQDGNIHWDSVPYCKCDEPDKYLLESNDILFARTGATTGKTHLVRDVEKAVFASYLIRLRPKKAVLPEYLYSFFQSNHYWAQILDDKEGSAQPNVNGKKLAAIKIPNIAKDLQSTISNFLEAVRARQDGTVKPLPELPSTLSNARRIVERIEELVAKVEEARGLRSQSIEEINAIARSTARVAFADYSNCHFTVEELVGRANLKNGKSIKTVDQSSETHCIRLSAVRDGQIDCNDAKPIPMSVGEAKDYLVQPGDVFVVRGNGSKDLVGQAGLVKDCPKGTIFPDLFIRVPLDQDRILSSFFVAWWNSPQMRDRIQDAAKTTSGIWKINQGHIASFSVPVPPISEQQAIVTYLTELQNKVDSLRQLQIETARELDALLPSILDKAFKGEL
jgi:type I restriction enzyme, S subunit